MQIIKKELCKTETPYEDHVNRVNSFVLLNPVKCYSYGCNIKKQQCTANRIKRSARIIYQNFRKLGVFFYKNSQVFPFNQHEIV